MAKSYSLLTPVHVNGNIHYRKNGKKVEVPSYYRALPNRKHK